MAAGTRRCHGLALVTQLGVGARAAVGLALAALASMALASPAAAQDGIAFERCGDPAEADWECATHTVPLDHSGETPGTIVLALRRYRPPDAPDPAGRPPFFALAGGPGESAITALDLFEAVFGERASAYQLIVYDQRGTGLSGALTCPALGGQVLLSDPAQDDSTAGQVARCADQLGPRRAFYTTLDSVADIESLREALGAETIGIGGVSYGTYVSAVYAQQHPERTERIVLDSVISPGGREALQEPVFEAVARVVTDQCDEGACQGVTASPLGDLARIAGRLRSGRISGIVRDGRGRPRRRALDSEFELLQLMLLGDVHPALRAGQPAAFRAAARGDAGPLLRFAEVALGSSGAVGEQVRGPALSPALLWTTTCTDLDFPWPASMPPGEERDDLFRNALAAVPESVIWPFGRQALRRGSLAGGCRLWPLTDSAPPPDHPPFPDVPTFIVNGSADLRTPNSRAIEAQRDFAPGASLVLVEGQGHSVLGNVGCARTALGRFFADQPIGNPCADVDAADPVQPLAPLRIRNVGRAPGTRGPRGRTLGAVLATIGDARWLHEVFPGRVGGLRGGWVAFRFRERTRFVLRRLSYIPRVRVNGSLRLRNDERLVGRLRVRGRRAVNGTVRFRPNGRVIGWLRGQRVGSRDTTR